jgi:hypothetical protein
MTDLPPELAAFASLLDAHLCPRPIPSRDGLRHAGLRARERGTVCFESPAGEGFSVARPRMSKEEEAALIAKLREIRDEEGAP